MSKNAKPAYRAYVVKNYKDETGAERSRWSEIGWCSATRIRRVSICCSRRFPFPAGSSFAPTNRSRSEPIGRKRRRDWKAYAVRPACGGAARE
jgi:hypothetical protein